MRLIDADRTCMYLADLQLANRGWKDDFCEILDDLMEAIDEQPTIDAAPVDTVAKMFCDFTGDSCACNFNGNDEWLPEVCELQDECPYPQDRFGCWKQYIKHYGERKEGSDNG